MGGNIIRYKQKNIGRGDNFYQKMAHSSVKPHGRLPSWAKKGAKNPKKSLKACIFDQSEFFLTS
jgi:hypothetical protein